MLRDYQKAAIDAVYSYFMANSGHPLLVLPTGAGKSHIIAAFIKGIFDRWPDQRVLMLTHVKELIAQNADKLSHHWPLAPMGICSAGLNRRDIFDSIIFASIQSVYNKADLLGRFDLVIVDECHLINHKANGMYRRLLDDLKAQNSAIKVIGLTATPFRTTSGDITQGDSSLFTDVAYEVPLLKLVDDGYLAPLVSKKTSAEIDLSNVHVRAGEFIQKELKSATDRQDLTKAAVQEIIQYGMSRRSWLIFCAGIDHAEHVCEELKRQRVPADVITSRTPATERDRIIRDYKSGQITALTNADVLTTGFDAPATDLIAFLRATHSPGLYVQMAGRGMRLSPETGKKNCLVLDFASNVARHGPVDEVKAWTPGKKMKGEAVMKACAECSTLVAAAVRVCPECGLEFPFEEQDKHSATASDLDVMSTWKDPREFINTYPVDAVYYDRHEKPGKPISLKVSYQCGLRIFREWVCLEHEGYARQKAHGWWVRRDPGAVIAPENVDEALELVEFITKPSTITVNEQNKYPEIVGYEFDNTSGQGTNDGHVEECHADR